MSAAGTTAVRFCGIALEHPIVNASGGPNCRGLPDIPTKQTGGSFYRSPFLVTDNANIPYEPFTELQFDAPSTLQFLFHGAFAERDDF